MFHVKQSAERWKNVKSNVSRETRCDEARFYYIKKGCVYMMFHVKHMFGLLIDRDFFQKDISQFLGYLFVEWTGIILGILSCCMSLNWSVELKESTFLYTNSFGIKREYRYDEFYSKPMRACWRYYKKGRKLYLFSISYMIPNSDLLEEKLQEHNMKKNRTNKAWLKMAEKLLCHFLCIIDNLIFPQVIFCLVITNKIFFKIFQFFVTLCRIFIHSIMKHKNFIGDCKCARRQP